jgi:ribonuclease-3
MFDFLLRPFKRNFGRDKNFYAAIDDMFGFIPNNIELYKVALIHKSASVELDDGRHINNERLEFLGDAVIESVTSDYLFIEFPDKDEGFMTQLRSKMVSRQSLNRVASELGLDKYVISNAAGNVTQKHIYGDAFEAMMGAIYLDQGYDFVNRLLINTIFARHISLDDVLQSETDFKSRLIEWCQKNHYSIEFRTGGDSSQHGSRPMFYSTVYIDGLAVGHGTGDSKKRAEQNAAFSVSQGSTMSLDDENSAKILDRIDQMVS